MGAASTSSLRVRIDGKFFRLGEEKFFLKGICYGPFAPGTGQESFASPEQTARDFAQIRELGANLLRVYHVPPRWFLDLAAEHELKLLLDIPWDKNRCFLDSEKTRENARDAVRQAVRASAAHPAVLAYSVVNEIPAEIVRWSGARATADFIDELVAVAKSVDAGCLCTFGNYPPTEFLRPRSVDFVCFNVYLHEQRALSNYLTRLQMQAADSKPLVLGEFGIDSEREGEARKCQIRSWTIETACRAGLAGAVVFSFTDDWVAGGRQVEEWSMGLTTRARQPKDSFFAVQKMFRAAPYFPHKVIPKVSVVVACYNGARTLRPCLDSLVALNYPNYEVLVVDDGSTDASPQIASLYPSVRYFYQSHHGLSVARNTGISCATGEIVAFTDADCRADEDWLYYLVGELLENQFAGVGGPNYLPAEDSPVAAAVMVSPGGPAHVMLSDRVAEHIPGCNMAFYKWALEEAGGFDPQFEQAGDDVDLCWRLQQLGCQLGFSPSAFVWHYRRSTVADYLEQQRGYGAAEALLARKHPESFNIFGGGLWRGQIYSTSKFGLILRRPVVYHGMFGTGFFQTLYAPQPAATLMLFSSLEYHVLVTLPLLVLSGLFHFLLPLGLASLSLSFGVCVAAAVQAELPKHQQRLWSRPLVALLFFLQPIVRGWARYHGRLSLGPVATIAQAKMEAQDHRGDSVEALYYWTKTDTSGAPPRQHESSQPVAAGSDSRLDFLDSIIARLDEQGWPNKLDSGWCDHDLEVCGGRWSRVHVTTVMEQLAGSNQLLRCRLRATWSLLAKICFWTACGLELLLVGLAGHWPLLWIWALLGILLLFIFGWFLKLENRNLKNAIASLIDSIAKDRSLTRLDYRREEDKFVPR